jgi:hypothetical protein
VDAGGVDRALAKALNQSAEAEVVSPELLRQIEQRIAQDLRPVHPASTARLFAALMGISGLAVFVSAYLLGTLGLTAMSFLQVGVILAALVGAVVLTADSLIRQMSPGSRHRMSPEWLPTLIIVSLVFVVAVSFQFQRQPEFWKNWWGCFRPGALIGVIVAIPYWFVVRRGAILSPLMAGAAGGLLAGLVSVTVLAIRCPDLNAWHVLFSHVGVAAAGVFAGLVAGYLYDLLRPMFTDTSSGA